MADQEKKEKKPSIHAGHRQRVKEEFLERGLGGVPDHKVLELLLFFAIPQGDVNPLAHALLDRFGSLSGVFHASYQDLQSVRGVGENAAALIKLFPEIAARYLEDVNSFDGQLVSTWQFRSRLEYQFIGAQNERVCLLCMDGKGKELDCKNLGEGIADAVHITARKVLEVALACNATRVVLAHNHVSGVALPSDSDVATTLRLKHILREAGVELVDHLIFAAGDMVSMAESGMLREKL